MNLKFLVIRTILESDNAKAGDVASIFSVSNEKVNNAVNEAVNEGLIERKGKYVVTKKGIEYLEKYRVDGAIILASGIGSRLQPLTFDTPKCFVRIRGEKLIERQIEQILRAGIKDITIVVGYMADKFEYLKYKYGVNLIYNPEYQIKNTLATFYNTKEKIINKNIYICVADVFMVNNIYHKYECESYYSSSFLSELGNEWRYITDDDKKIKGVMVGGKDDFAMMGPAFMTKEFSNLLIPFINETYNKPDTEKYYWEDVLAKNFNNLPPMYEYRQPKYTMYEFDNYEDIKKFDDEIETGCFSFNYICDLFHVKERDIKDIKCIKNGLTNKSYTFTIDKNLLLNNGFDKSKIANKYICRVPGIGTELYIDRKNEKKIYEGLEGKGIAEEIVGFDEDGVKVSIYFDNARILDKNNQNEIIEAIKILHKFHNLGIKVNNTCNPMAKVNDCINIINQYNIKIKDKEWYDSLLNKTNVIDKYIKKFNRPKVLIHGDCNPENFLVTDLGMKLIDYEYSGMDDPLNDLGVLCLDCGFDIKKTFDLVDIYINENTNDDIDINEARMLVVGYMALNAVWWILWIVGKEALTNSEYNNILISMDKSFNDCYNYLINHHII